MNGPSIAAVAAVVIELRAVANLPADHPRRVAAIEAKRTMIEEIEALP